MWLVKTDFQGETLWTKTFGGLGEERGYSIIETNYFGYVISGFTESYGLGYQDMWLIKLDPNGDTVPYDN